MSSNLREPEFWHAGKRAAAKIPKTVTIEEPELDDDGKIVVLPDGDVSYKQRVLLVRRTGEALKKVAEQGAHDAIVAQERRKRIEDARKKWAEDGNDPDQFELPPDPEDAGRGVDQLYNGLAHLLIDPETGDNPDPVWLAKWLDFEVASDWMEVLMPSGPPPRAEETAEAEPEAEGSSLPTVEPSSGEEH